MAETKAIVLSQKQAITFNAPAFIAPFWQIHLP